MMVDFWLLDVVSFPHLHMNPHVQLCVSVAHTDKNLGCPGVDFAVKGKLTTSVCSITKPFTGEITVLHSEAPIKSIELQLVRVETCGCLEGYAKDATEIQNIQIAEGDVCRDLAIPLYMIFPRLFTCPTLATDNFKVEFEVNIVIVLTTGDLITENFPIKLLRS
eukprot:m.659164 g.659164  ORF g.659164 m.659164 type:complete len:164 (-) comp22722_c0_seq1:3452-3943(-)